MTNEHLLDGLTTLSFEYFVANEASQIEVPIQRRQVLSAHAVVHACYFLKLFYDVSNLSANIGILGLGCLGSTLLSAFLDLLNFPRAKISVWSRSIIEENFRMKFRAVKVLPTPREVVSSCDLVFVCVPSSAIEEIAKSCVGCISEKTIIYVFNQYMVPAKLRHLFDHENIIKESYDLHLLTKQSCHVVADVYEAFLPKNLPYFMPRLDGGEEETRVSICPSKNFCKWIAGLINYLSSAKKLDKYQVLACINHTLNMGKSPWIVDDIAPNSLDKSFPLLDLVEIDRETTPIERALDVDPEKRAALRKHLFNTLSPENVELTRSISVSQ